MEWKLMNYMHTYLNQAEMLPLLSVHALHVVITKRDADALL